MNSKKMTVITFSLILLFTMCLVLSACTQIYEQVNTDIIVYNSIYNRITTSAPGLGIMLNYDHDNFVMESSCIKGHLGFQNETGQYTEDQHAQSFMIWWDAIGANGLLCYEDYVIFIIRDGDYIIGYGILHIKSEDQITYYSELLISYEFPKINSHYQHVKEKYIQNQIKKYITFAQDENND